MSKQSSWNKLRAAVRYVWIPFIQLKNSKKSYPWLQLAGHRSNFIAGKKGTLMKKYCREEATSLQALCSRDEPLHLCIPSFLSIVMDENDEPGHIEMQDLLSGFDNPSVMDCKLGTRTYLESEITGDANLKFREDLYSKMAQVDLDAPTEEEHLRRSITKARYMQWREQASSSADLGFRIDGVKMSDSSYACNLKTLKSREEVKSNFRSFFSDCLGELDEVVIAKYHDRLQFIRQSLTASPFFTTNEVIGSSLLFIHDRHHNASVWMIDFGKTVPLPEGVRIDHTSPWKLGNHEDGYLFGFDNLLNIVVDIKTECNAV